METCQDAPVDELDRDHWNARYASRDTPWDKGDVAPPIARLVAEGVLPAGGRVLVPGAGTGHEALHLARAGFRVVALDFARLAVEAMRERATAAGVALDARQQDVFEIAGTDPAAFDAVVEHTIFCAIAPGRRSEYARVIHDALAPRGIFTGLFYAHGREAGPPFTTGEAEVRGIFGGLFEIERLAVAPDSFPERAGAELEFVFRRRAA